MPFLDDFLKDCELTICCYSAEDFCKLLQRMDALKMKIYPLEVNLEVKTVYGNETTLHMTRMEQKRVIPVLTQANSSAQKQQNNYTKLTS